MKENVGIKAQSRVGVRNSEQGAVHGLRLTVQWDGGLDLGAVIMTLLNTPEFGGKKVLGVSRSKCFAWQVLCSAAGAPPGTI